MQYLWELLKAIFPFIFRDGKHEYRDDFEVAYNSLYKLTQLLQKQIEQYDDKIQAQSKRIDELQDIRYTAQKLQLELKKCEEAYAKCRERSQ